MRRGKGFTLIELLVVIAIIALLMAILMPTLRAAKDQARKTVCTSHIKGLMVSVKMYVDDYDGKTHNSPNNGLWDNAHSNPTTVREYGPNEDRAYWGIAYFPYSKNKKIFRCPSTVRVDDWPEWGPPWGLPSQQYFAYCSYGINGYIAKERETGQPGKMRNTNVYHDFKRPSEVIAFQDHLEQKLDSIGSDMFCIGPGNSINLTQWRNGGTQGNFPDAVQECFRHRGTSMTVWLDGHVTEIEETTGEDVPAKWYTGIEN
jgi:prepilin-type N-terminal cleavage/methylation domain-containing protein/prepilin-type processing-associated H-X9-DG protein